MVSLALMKFSSSLRFGFACFLAIDMTSVAFAGTNLCELELLVLSETAPSYPRQMTETLREFFSSFKLRFAILEYARASRPRRAEIRKETGKTASELEGMQKTIEEAARKTLAPKNEILFRGEAFAEERPLPKVGETLEYPQLLSTSNEPGLAAL